mgnify:CR=1 FL=1
MSPVTVLGIVSAGVLIITNLVNELLVKLHELVSLGYAFMLTQKLYLVF